MSERRMAVLDVLGAQFRRLGEPPTYPAGFTQRTLLIAVVLALLLAAVTPAAMLITGGR